MPYPFSNKQYCEGCVFTKYTQKDRANDVAALISNFDTAIKMVDTAENSFGSASSENAKYLDSLQGRIDVMTASFQAMSSVALDSDFLKGAVSGATALIDVFSVLIDDGRLIPAILASISAGFTIFRNQGVATVDEVNGKLNIFGKTLQEIVNSFSSGGLSGGIKSLFSNDKSPFDDFAARLEKDKEAFEKYQRLGEGASVNDVANALSEASDELKNMAHNGELASMTWEEFSTNQRKSVVATQATNKSLKSVNSLIAEYNNQGRTVGLTQAQFVDAVSQSNTVLGSYLSGLSGTNATLGGYARALVGTTAKTVALTAASTALNFALTMGIGVAIGAIISGISSLITYYDDLAESVEASSTAFSEANSKLMDNKSSYESAVQTYDELSKGVNSLGENMSLTADEYEEYQNAVNTIAESAPSMVAGFDAQGNAILNTSASVETLTDAYNELIAAEAKAFLKGDEEKGYVGLDKIAEDYAHDLQELQRKDLESYQILDDLLGSSDIEGAIDELPMGDVWNLRDRLKEMGLTQDWGQSDADFIAEAIKSDTDTIRKAVDEQMAAYDDMATEMGQAAEAMLNESLYGDTKLADMSDSIKNMLTQYVSGFDGEFFEQLISENGGDSKKVDEYLERYMDDITSSFEKLSTTQQQAISDAFTAQTDFEIGDITMDEFADKAREMDEVLKSIGLDDDARKEMMLSLGFEYDDNGAIKEFTKDYEAAIERFSSNKNKEAIENWLGDLSGSELDMVLDMELEGDETVGELKEALKLAKALNNVGSIDIQVESEGIDNFNTALSESRSASGLTSASIDALANRYSGLEGANYNAAKLFEETANGIRLNTEEVNRLEEAYASQQKQKIDDDLSILKTRYEELGTEIANCSDINQRAELYGEQEEIRAKINELAELGAAYEGLTSNFKQWQDAESAGSDRDMYESVLSGFESIGDEISRGWLDDASKQFIELMTFDESSLSSIDDYINRWNQLDDTIQGTTYSVKDFFTQNENGESTNNGVYNFLDAVDQLNNEQFKIERNADGVITSFDFGVNGDKAVAEALGISEELVQIIERAAEDAGFVINMNGAYTQLADLQNQAETSAQKLKELGKTDFDFDFDTTSIDSLNEQLTEAKSILDQFKNEDGTIKTNADGSYVEGAQEAIDVMSTLTAMADKLSEPTYMQLETNQVEEGLQDTLTDLQKYEDLVKQKHQLEITGADTSEIDASMKEIADKIANNSDLKAKLNIDADATTEDVQRMLEAGEIEIPATVDIQMEMDEKLNDIRLLLMNQAGLLSDTELKLAFELDTTALDGYTPEEKEAVVNFFADTEDVDKYTPEEKQAIAKYIKDIDDVESWTPEAKKAVCDFIVNNEEVMNYTPEEKFAIAKYMVNGGDVEDYDIPGKEAIVEFVAEHGEVDDWNPEDREAVARFLLDKSEVEGYEIEDKTANIVVTTNGLVDVENLKAAMDGLTNKETQVIVDAIGSGDVQALKDAIDNLDSKTVQAICDAFGYEDVETLKASINSMDGKEVEAICNALGYDDVEDLKYSIHGLKGKDVDVDADVNGKKDVDNLASSIRNVPSYKKSVIDVITNKVTNTITNFASNIASAITGKHGVNGSAHIDGTAHASGTVNSGRAFKQGDWRTKKDEVALTGELGPELIVPPNGNMWYTVGDNGAEFAKIPRGSIIFNHKQTEELFKNGYVTSNGGRGRAYAQGTAFSSGSGGLGPAGGGSGWKPAGGSSSSSSSSSSSNNNSSNKSSTKQASEDAEEFSEKLDWIEIAIDRIERAIDSLDRTASSAFKSWGERTNALNQQMQKVTDEIALQQQAYDRYMQEAQSSGLSADLQNKVMNGAIDIELITDETLKEQIDDFQQWYEKALDAKDAAEELKITLSELAKTEFENIIQQFEDMIETADHTHSMIDEYIAQSEAQGWIVSSKYYEAQRKNLKKQYQLLQEERGELLGELSANMANGTIKKGTQEWYEAVHAIDDVTQSAEEMYTQMLELDQLIQQADWEVFDLMQERISDIANEADFLIDLMSNEKLYEDNGQLTDRGQATMGLHGVNYNTYMAQADKYAEELRKIEAELAGDPYDTELIARRQELLDAQRDNILAAEQEKDAIKDMVEEGIQLELDYLDDLIDKYLEALQAQKDLYDYENEIRDKTDDIAMLQKQLSAYEGDSSEEAKSTIQQLTQELTEAQRELQDAEYERQISDVERLLDQMRLDYETILNSRLDNIDQLIIDMIANINANAGTISDVITSEANNVGYTLTDQMQSIWNDGNQVISYYGDNFLSSMNNVVTVINQIDTHIQSMMSKLDSIAQNKINSDKTQSSANSPQASTPVKPTPTPTPQQPSSSGGDGVPKVGDKVKFVSGNYYNDSYGTSPLGYHNRGGYVYITAINKKGSKPYHISRGSRLGSGDLGWLTLAQLSGYATGKRKIVDDEYAWTQENGAEMIVRPSDGAVLTPLAKNDSVLNADAARNIWNMANNPSDFVKENLGLGGNSVSPATTGGTTNYTQNLENVVFNLPNVKNYEQLLASMQKDRNFERLISSMTVDKIAGKNGMKKSKAIR